MIGIDTRERLRQKGRELYRSGQCSRTLTKFEFGSPDHIRQCAAITGEVTADVIEMLVW